jgi:glycosyltransferase involved in cell wall biosynthesis
MKISVLTATYNRAHTLPKLYNSLILNSAHGISFEWLIMDDGSTDETKSLIDRWSSQGLIDIKYHFQNNMGKMSALNNLLEHITGDITVECDSDDYFTNDAFLKINENWGKVENNPDIIGLAFLRIYEDNSVVGTKFKKEKVSNIFDIYFKDQIKGDKVLIFKSNIRKNYKHILEANEKFATEGRMYHQMGKQYDGFMCMNIPAIYCEYLEDGYTKNIINIFKKSPHGHYQYYLEMFDLNMTKLPFNKRIHIIKHYILFSYLTNKSIFYTITNVKGSLNLLLVTILSVPGYIMSNLKFK